MAKELGPLASSASVPQAITEGDTVVLAVWLDTLREILPENADQLRGKVVIDPTNPISWTATARWRAPYRRVNRPAPWSQAYCQLEADYVKAFGTLGAQSLAASGQSIAAAICAVLRD